jgi:DNA-binding NtrC family response regulator
MVLDGNTFISKTEAHSVPLNEGYVVPYVGFCLASKVSLPKMAFPIPGMSTDKAVLVVEDEVEMSKLIDYSLKEAGYKPVVAQSTQEAMARLNEGSFKGLLLDIALPGESGLEFLPKFKKLYPNIPVIILTGLGYDNTMMKTALDQGAAGFFSKETGIENLIPVVKHLIK